MPDTPQSPKRKRRWFRFSLRTLLVVVTIFCVALAYWVHRANRQKAVVKWVKDNGGSVRYDFEFDEKGDDIEDAKPPGPEWVRAHLGKDYLATVNYVALGDSEVKDLAPLAKLGHLENLYLFNTPVSDLTPLAGLTRLEVLYLGNTQVSDLTPLTGLTRLEYLYLYYTPVTQEQIDELQKALPNCKIGWSPEIFSRTRWRSLNSLCVTAKQPKNRLPSSATVRMADATREKMLALIRDDGPIRSSRMRMVYPSHTSTQPRQTRECGSIVDSGRRLVGG